MKPADGIFTSTTHTFPVSLFFYSSLYTNTVRVSDVTSCCTASCACSWDITERRTPKWLNFTAGSEKEWSPMKSQRVCCLFIWSSTPCHKHVHGIAFNQLRGIRKQNRKHESLTNSWCFIFREEKQLKRKTFACVAGWTWRAWTKWT